MSRLVNVQIKIDDHGALARMEKYPALQATAMARALTRTAAWARTRTVEAIVGNLAVKKSDLDGKHRFGGVTATKATKDKLEARVSISGGRIPLFRFNGRPTRPSPGQRRLGGVSYSISPAGKKEISTNAFVARMPSGHIGFFRRLSDAKHKTLKRSVGGKTRTVRSQLRISELYGPSIPHVAEKDPAFQRLLAVDAGEHLEIEMMRQVNYILTGDSGKSE